MKDVGAFLHDSDVFRRGVGTLAVLYGIDEAVSELSQRAQEICLDEIHHVVVCERKIGLINVKIFPYTSKYAYADLHSSRLFCSGVPVSMTLRRVLMALMALETFDFSFRNMCPSSHTTMSGPEQINAC